MANSYTDLEPDIAQSLTGQKLAFDASQAASLFTTTSFLYTTSIMLIVGVAAARYMLAGVWRIEASERGVRKSNEEIKRVTFGLLGVLSLFVILYTFNKDLLTGEVGLAGLKSTAGALPITGVPTQTTPTTPVTNAAEQAVRDSLAAAGITINKNPCTDQQVQQTSPSGPPPDCTNVGGLPSASINMLIALKDYCPGSSIVVTGGTEPGHKSHGPGLYPVDIRRSGVESCVQNTSKFNVVPTPGFCKAAYSGLGFVFCDEKGTDHWHVFR